jgi:hypothetical protein
LPSDAAPSPNAQLTAVSCWSTRNCTAVGFYLNGSGDFISYAVNEVNGAFGTPTVITPPTGSATNPSEEFYGISCASAGNCTAVGNYVDASNNSQGVLVNEVNGSFQSAVELTPPSPADANPQVFLGGVSCWSAGNCTVVGQYEDSSNNFQGFVESESSGNFQPATELVLPSNANSTAPDAALNAVSCWAASDCSAVGIYTDMAGNQQGLVASESIAGFSQGVEVAAPGNAASNPQTYLAGIGCVASGSCTGVGDYSDGNGNDQLLVASGNGPTFTQSAEVPAPANANAQANASLNAVSCTSAGNCTAVGSYNDNSGTPGNTQALEASDSSGSFQSAIELSSPSNSAGDPDGSLAGVSCSGAGSCVAVGDYQDSSSRSETMALNSLPSLSIAEATSPVATTGSAYSAQLSASGGIGSFSFAVSAGTLPAGLALNAATGAITGTPTVAGAFSPTITVSDPGPPVQHASIVVSIHVTAALSLTSGALPSGRVGERYLGQLSATGGVGDYSFSLSAGTLPPGLSLDAATGVISGVASASISSLVTFSVSDPGPPAQIATGQFYVDIAPPKPKLALLSTTAVVEKTAVPIKLRCSSAKCAGRATLNETVLVNEKLGKKVVIKHEALALGSASYSLKVDKKMTLDVDLNSRGRTVLAHVSKHALRETIVITLRGASALTKTLTIS